ncbi:hypothetical protein V5E97_30835 [Singulisphaera sp. Ch08]|uniref:TIGR03067 domain-containing protein n=1 Tax=Singulisphaera sp. Ch08 TaxID=3120278 RepID=A0AAU7CCK8_9BACT
MNKAFCACLTITAVLLTPALRAQTVQGDVLRGQGRYLEGAGWYNLNTARAGRINVETWKSHNREVQRLYRDYMIDRSRHIQYKKGLTNKLQAELLRKIEEDQRRWRESPTPEDIASGDALNALAGDLADPSISPSSWRTAQVDLPAEMTLTKLAFKVADTKKSKLQLSTVAVDRMLVRDRWPLPFRRPEIERECTAYEKAVTAVVDKCRKGTELQAADYDRLREAVVVLQKAVETDVPSRDDQRRQARDYVRRLDESTKIFAEEAYAEQLIRDVSEHKATTVAELLAFMRDYRLLFADPGTSPEVASIYEGLYGLLRQQKDALGPGAGMATGMVVDRSGVPSDVFATGSVWVTTEDTRPFRNLQVLERKPGGFRGLLKTGKEVFLAQEIQGEVSNDTVSWRGGDAKVVNGPQLKAQLKAQAKGQPKAQLKAMLKKAQANLQAQGKGFDCHGTIKGEEIHVTFMADGRRGSFVLRKTR